jgi:ABC-2 type transport system ATP-binding protein
MYVQINDFTKTIGGNTVLDAIRVGFEEGTVNGIVGPNGSGKTMLLRALCGFIRPTAGSVSIAGKPVVFNESLPERVGVIIEVPGFIAARTAMENLEYLAGLDGGWDPRETLRLMSLFDLYEHRDEKVKSYSLGMRQKLAIVQALMEHQRLVLLDEPTNGLDRASVTAFLEEIGRQREGGAIVIIASHHDDEIRQVCDHIYTMENGRLDTDHVVSPAVVLAGVHGDESAD